MDIEDYGLSTLLSMHEYQFTFDNGYWWKIEAYAVPVSATKPHGVKYSLTLHDHYNKRIFGMDNAHAIKPPKKGFSTNLVAHDHMHRNAIDKGYPYTFTSAEQLLQDFFDNVDRIMDSLKSK